jgi:hypothetical protein
VAVDGCIFSSRFRSAGNAANSQQAERLAATVSCVAPTWSLEQQACDGDIPHRSASTHGIRVPAESSMALSSALARRTATILQSGRRKFKQIKFRSPNGEHSANLGCWRAIFQLT